MSINQAQLAQYLSQRFTKRDFANMSNDKMFGIYSAPDTGKTTLITNVLQPYLKKNKRKALYLSHRRVINDQNEANFDNAVIHSKTYQKIEEDIINNIGFFKDYDFIICDECHYFVEDTAMNNNTDISFNFVNKSNSIVILMSSTPDYLEGIKDQWIRPIVILEDINKNNHNITKLCLASATKEEEALLKLRLERLVKMRKRIIIYDSNIAELYQFSSEYKCRQEELGIKVSFICSKRNKDFAVHCDTEDLEALTSTRHIKSDLLFITSALNTGVSIDEDFEYLFIFGNPSKTDIFQLIARVRKGNNNRHLKTVYCQVPKYNSLSCRLKGLELDLSYQDNPVEWQRITKSKSFPNFMQLKYSYMYDRNDKQLFTPEGNPKTEYRQDINYMILGKLKQDIKEYKYLLSFGNMIDAYKKIFIDRYANISISTFKDELEQQGVTQLINKLNDYTILEYLGEDQKECLKSICEHHGLLTSISKINELLDRYNCGISLISDQRKLDGHKFQAWYINRY